MVPHSTSSVCGFTIQQSEITGQCMRLLRLRSSSLPRLWRPDWSADLTSDREYNRIILSRERGGSENRVFPERKPSRIRTTNKFRHFIFLSYSLSAFYIPTNAVSGNVLKLTVVNVNLISTWNSHFSIVAILHFLKNYN